MTFDVAAAHPDCLPRFLGSFTAGVFIFTARHHFFRVTPKGGSRWRVRELFLYCTVVKLGLNPPCRATKNNVFSEFDPRPL